MYHDVQLFWETVISYGRDIYIALEHMPAFFMYETQPYPKSPQVRPHMFFISNPFIGWYPINKTA